MSLKKNCYSCYFRVYYYLKGLYISGKKQIKNCISSENEEPLENAHQLEEVVVINDDLPNLENNINYNFKYINSSSSEEVIYDRNITQQPQRKLKRKNALRIRNRIAGKKKIKKSTYKNFENKIPAGILEKTVPISIITDSDNDTDYEENTNLQNKKIQTSEDDWDILE